jgi:toxin YoeB
MIYIIRYSKQALIDLARLKKSEIKVFNKAIKLIQELSEHPRTGTGKPEQKKYDLKGYWSRNITDKHRLFYTIKDEEVIVLVISAYGHYDDK